MAGSPFSYFALLALVLVTLSVTTTEASEEGAISSLSVPSGGFEEASRQDGETQSQARPRRLSENGVQCNEQSTDSKIKTVDIDELTLQATFTCVAPFATFLPETGAIGDGINKCCKDKQCTEDPVEISAVFGVNGKAKRSTANTYTVTLPRIPDEKRGDTKSKLFYVCREAPNKDCVVAVGLPAQLGERKCFTSRPVV